MPRFLHLRLHLLVVLFATTSVFGHLITLSAPALVAWRTFLAAAGGAFLIGVVQRRDLRLPLKRVLALIGIGAIVGLHWICFFGAIKLANISICMAGMATTSFFTAFSEPLFERRRIRSLEVALGLLIVLGISLIAGFERGCLAGLGVALLAAMFASVFPVLNRRLVNQGRMDPLVMTTWEMVGACLVCLACMPWLDGPGAYERMFQFHGYDALWLLFLAWGCTIFAYAFYIHLLRYLSAYTANLAANFEPVYGILAAALLFGEHRQLHPGFFLGTASILLANILHPLILRHLARGKDQRVTDS
jgi:drug/metabolite transporter (DMT)-like permease